MVVDITKASGPKPTWRRVVPWACAVGLVAGTAVAVPSQAPAGALPRPGAPAAATTGHTHGARTLQHGTLGAFGGLPSAAAGQPAISAAGDHGRGAATRLAALSTGSLLTFTYSLIKESDGEVPAAGAQVSLVFGANGTAYVYACNATEADADNGSYSYAGGRLTLHVHAADLDINATFALDLSMPEVTMPFQIFTEKPGTSLWEQEPMAVDQGILASYNAAINTAQLTSPEQAASDAFKYAEAFVAAQGSAGSLAGAQQAARYQPARSSRVACGAFCIASVTSLGDDIQVKYRNGQSVLVSLYNAGPQCNAPGDSCTSLSLSPLASDPRVFLDPTTHPDSQFDPPNKQAVFIAPVADIEDPAALADMATILKQRGYVVKQSLNAGASLLGIAALLKASPGYVLFSTHGNEDGQLLTGQTVATSGLFTAKKIQDAYQQLASELRSEGLQTLSSFKMGTTPAYYIGEPNCSYKLEFSPTASACSWKVVITPAFWKWLEADEGANFSHSLVFISACETDATATLRDTVKARAYFAFTQDVASNFATAVERYMAEALWRPTHSAEETFYNMLRVEKTHQMVYKEDAVLQGALGDAGSDASFDIMDGWGWDGSNLVNYRDSGWLSGRLDAGQVWWMLYAARWSPNTTTGAANLNNCYSKYWSHGNPGGLASPYCNAANAGIPSDPSSLKKDVAYAIYLLNGTPPAGFSAASTPPRWTLDD